MPVSYANTTARRRSRSAGFVSTPLTEVFTVALAGALIRVPAPRTVRLAEPVAV